MVVGVRMIVPAILSRHRNSWRLNRRRADCFDYSFYSPFDLWQDSIESIYKAAFPIRRIAGGGGGGGGREG